MNRFLNIITVTAGVWFLIGCALSGVSRTGMLVSFSAMTLTAILGVAVLIVTDPPDDDMMEDQPKFD